MQLFGYFNRFGEHKTGLIALLFVSIVLNLGYGILVPFIPIFAQNIGASVGVIGFIVSAFTIGRAASASIAGDYSDRIGRKRVMLVGTIIYAISTATMALAQDWITLLLLRILEGVAVGIVWPTAQAHLVDLVPTDKVGEAVGLYTTTFTFGFFGGPLIGSAIFYVVETFGGTHTQALIAPFYATGTFALIAAILVYNIIQDVPKIELNKDDNLYPSSEKKESKDKEPIKIETSVPDPKGEYKKYYGMSLLNGVGIGFIIPIFAIFFVDVHGFNEAAVGVILGIGGGITSALSGPSGYLSDKFGRRPLLLLGIPLMIFGTILLGFVGTFLMASTFFWIRAVGNGLYIPSFRSLQAEVVLPVERGKIFGRTQTWFNAGAVIGPIVGSFLYDYLAGVEYNFINFVLIGEAVPFVLTGLFQGFMMILAFSLKYPQKEDTGSIIEISPSKLEPETSPGVIIE